MDESYVKLIDLLSYESDFFSDVERVILMDMLKRSRERDKRFYGTPFIYTSTMVSRLGFDYNILSELRYKLYLMGIITYEKKTTPGYQYAVTFYLIDEKKLFDFLSSRMSKVG